MATDTPAGLSVDNYRLLVEAFCAMRQAGAGSQRHSQAVKAWEGVCQTHGVAILTMLAGALGEPVPEIPAQNLITRAGEVTVIGG